MVTPAMPSGSAAFASQQLDVHSVSGVIEAGDQVRVIAMMVRSCRSNGISINSSLIHQNLNKYLAVFLMTSRQKPQCPQQLTRNFACPPDAYCPPPQSHRPNGYGRRRSILVIIAIAVFFFIYNSIMLWWQSVLSKAPVSLMQIVFMRFRKVNPDVIVRNRITSAKAGLER